MDDPIVIRPVWNTARVLAGWIVVAIVLGLVQLWTSGTAVTWGSMEMLTIFCVIVIVLATRDVLDVRRSALVLTDATITYLNFRGQESVMPRTSATGLRIGRLRGVETYWLLPDEGRRIMLSARRWGLSDPERVAALRRSLRIEMS